MQELKSEIVADFFSHDIIKVNTDQFFTLSSGLKFPIYLDHRRIFSFPRLRNKVISAWGMMLKDQIHTQYAIDVKNNANIVFSGTATAGIAPAYALSTLFQSGFIYVRDKSKAYGLHSQVEGVAEPQNKFVVVDDMVVTGSSLLKNCLVLKNLYGSENILCATSISCHESSTMRKTFEENGIYFSSLFTTSEMFNIAHKLNVITSETFEILMKYLQQLTA